MQLSEADGIYLCSDPDATLSTTVVLCVAEVLGRDHDELPPLANVCDPDALNDIFVDGNGASLSVEFHYSQCLVTISQQEEHKRVEIVPPVDTDA